MCKFGTINYEKTMHLTYLSILNFCRSWCKTLKNYVYAYAYVNHMENKSQIY